MGRDERCGEYFVWQILFACAECHKPDEDYFHFISEKADRGPRMEALILEKGQVKMEETSP